MQVKEVMSKNPQVFPDNTFIKQVADAMQKNDFGFAPVKVNGQIGGIVTDRDIIIRAIADGKDVSHTHVKDIMTTKVFSCLEDDDVKTAADNMSKHQVHRLVVLDKAKNIVGIISLGDIARKCNDTNLCGKVTELISAGKHS